MVNDINKDIGKDTAKNNGSADRHPVTAAPETDTTFHVREATMLRLARIEERLNRIEASDFVTRVELSAAMGHLSATLGTDIERRFDIQNRSVQSLRTMIARTDELLERVIESLESSETPA